MTEPLAATQQIEQAPSSGGGDGSQQAVGGRTTWERGFAWKLFVFDAAAALLAEAVALGVGTHSTTAFVHGSQLVARIIAGLILVLGWLVMLAVNRAYEPRLLGYGPDEFRFVVLAAGHFLAGIALLVFLFEIEIYPAHISLVIGTSLGLTLLFRYAARKMLHRRRARGQYLRQVLAVGSRAHVKALADHLGSVQYAGLKIVGALSPVGSEPIIARQGVIPFIDWQEGILAAIEEVGADTVALADTETISGDELRRLAWSLEDTGIDLLVAPAIVDVAGPRIIVRPLGGLPLLYVEEPEFTGATRWSKAIADRATALVGLLLLLPLFTTVILWIRLTSPGSALYRQRRVGVRGVEFEMLKFRSMVVDADEQLSELAQKNESDGLLFKVREDPRITPVGRVLRRYSIDELPQLFNVLRGDMSLVGPRPPLPSEVAGYGPDVRRRLLVKPGMTGLWQVSGRSDLPWSETVRLDLAYVENWSPMLDVQILWRTIPAITKGRGAY